MIEKIGHLLDDLIQKVAKVEAIKNPGPNDPVVNNTQKKQAAAYLSIFKRFEEISQDDSNKAISTRMRILVKNMLDNRA